MLSSSMQIVQSVSKRSQEVHETEQYQEQKLPMQPSLHYHHHHRREPRKPQHLRKPLDSRRPPAQPKRHESESAASLAMLSNLELDPGRALSDDHIFSEPKDDQPFGKDRNEKNETQGNDDVDNVWKKTIIAPPENAFQASTPTDLGSPKSDGSKVDIWRNLSAKLDSQLTTPTRAPSMPNIADLETMKKQPKLQHKKASSTISTVQERINSSSSPNPLDPTMSQKINSKSTSALQSTLSALVQQPASLALGKSRSTSGSKVSSSNGATSQTAPLYKNSKHSSFKSGSLTTTPKIKEEEEEHGVIIDGYNNNNNNNDDDDNDDDLSFCEADDNGHDNNIIIEKSNYSEFSRTSPSEFAPPSSLKLTEDNVRAFLADYYEDYESLVQCRSMTPWKVFWEKYCIPDYVYIRPSGNPISTDGIVAMLTNKDMTAQGMRMVSIDSVKVLAGDLVAVATYTCEQCFTYKGVVNEDQAVISSVLEVVNGEIKIVHEHRSTGRPVPKASRWQTGQS